MKGIEAGIKLTFAPAEFLIVLIVGFPY